MGEWTSNYNTINASCMAAFESIDVIVTTHYTKQVATERFRFNIKHKTKNPYTFLPPWKILLKGILEPIIKHIYP